MAEGDHPVNRHLEVREVGEEALDAFIALPFRLYRGDRNWVPSLRGDLKKLLRGVGNEFFTYASHSFFLAYEGRRPVARVLCGVNPRLKDDREAYEKDPSRDPSRELWGFFSLFEADGPDSASRILDAAEAWCRARGATHLKGPLSPDDGESARGILVQGFDGPPAVLNSYNPEWYGAAVEARGFRKWEDLYAMEVTSEELDLDRLVRLAEFSERRVGFRVDQADLKQIDRDVGDVYKVLVGAYPPGWDAPLPSRQHVDEFVRQNRSILDPALIHIARRLSDNEPIAFVLGVPDMNEALIHMRSGRLSPLNILRFLYYRRKVRTARGMMQFSLPEYHRRGVMAACYARSLVAAVKRGYTRFDASTIGERNVASWKSVENAGGRIYRVYRYYVKELAEPA